MTITNTGIDSGNGLLTLGNPGTAGTLKIFPATANKGQLVISAANATGNTNTTLTNAAMGQATVLTVPDPGVASSQFLLTDNASTQTISTGSLALATGNLTCIAGNVNAGSSGNAGIVSSFSSTPSKGSLQLAAVANTGNTNTVISNAAMGQASTISIPDPGGATANFCIAPSALVSGNIVAALGTSGKLIDTGIQYGLIGTFNANITLNQASVQGMYATPYLLLAAPGAGLNIFILNCVVYTNFQTSAFAGGGVVVVQYGNSAHGVGTNALSATIPAAEITAAASQFYTLNQNTGSVLTGITNTGLYLSNQTGAFTGGSASSTVVISLTYNVYAGTV